MYIPHYFEVTDKEKIFSFIEENAFGQLISNVGGRPFSTHLPLLLSEDKAKLIGHLAIQNPQHADIEDQDVLVTFQGPHDYISPSWYITPGVPTWNYQAVHIYGYAKIIKEPDEVQQVVDSLAEKFESAFVQPWQPEYKASMLGAVVAVEIIINEVQCKFKLSQNRSVQDRSQVVVKLKELGSKNLAEAMVRNEL